MLRSFFAVCLFLNDPSTLALYHHPKRLWPFPPVRSWVLDLAVWFAQPRKMDSDPVVFALRDWPSIVAGLIVALITVSAIL